MALRRVLLVFLAVTAFTMAGCFGGAREGPTSPYGDVKSTGRTIHLKVTVEDLFAQQVYPDPKPGGGAGLKANLWAFCVEPASATDAASAAAIEHWQALPGDEPELSEEKKASCSVPAPTIRVRQGDRVIVDFGHSHVHAHTIHWHGQFVPWEMDGAPGVSQAGVKTGETFRYDFVAEKAGTLWYHCHVDTQLHVQQGLFGAFIVEPADESEEPKGIDHDYVWLLGNMNRDQVEDVPGVPRHNHPPGCNTSGTEGCQNPTLVGPPDVFTINGHSYPLTMQQEGTLLRLGEGDRIRLRLINAGESTETIHPHGHDMLVTHRDGTPLESPFWVDTLSVGAAERYDVVIEGNNPGVWMVHTHVNLHETNDGASPGGMHSMIVYEGFEDQMHQFPDVLAGGDSFGTAPTIPGDVRFTDVHDLGTNSTALATTVLVLEQPCTTKQVLLRGRLTTQAGALDDGLGDLPVPTPPGGAPPPPRSLNDLRVTVFGPDGEPVPESPSRIVAGDAVEGVRLPSGGAWVELWNVTGAELGGWGAFDAFPKNLPAGGYRIEVSGRAVDAVVVFEVVVDSFGSFEEAKVSAELHRYTVCPGFGQ